MKSCINYNSKDYKEIVSKVGEDNAIRLVIANNGELPDPNHPEVLRMENFIKNKELRSPINEELENNLQQRLNPFLEKLGVSVQEVDKIKDRHGNTISAIAKADLLNKTIEYIKGERTKDTLPEEAGHMFVAFLPRNHPLRISMEKDIVNYSEYEEVKSKYTGYEQDADLEDSIRQEAIGKIISQRVLKSEENSRPKRWFTRVIDYLKQLFNSITSSEVKEMMDAYDIAAGKILSADITDLDPNLDIQGRNEFYQLKYTGPSQATINAQFEKNKKAILPPAPGSENYRLVEDDGTIREIQNRVTRDVNKEYIAKVGAEEVEKQSKDPRAQNMRVVGTKLHSFLEDIANQLIPLIGTKEYNKFKPTNEIEFEGKKISLKSEIFNKLEKQVRNNISAFQKVQDQINLANNTPDGKMTIWPELRIYDQSLDRAGTIDLIAVFSDGTVGKMDYKFINFPTKKKGKGRVVTWDSVPFYKQDTFESQSSKYKDTLKKSHGITHTRIDRTIPLNIQLKYLDGQPTTGIDELEIYDGTNDYLLPIPSATEETDDRQTNKLLSRLRNIYANLKIDIKNDYLDQDSKARADNIRKLLTHLLAKKDAQLMVNEIASVIDLVKEKIQHPKEHPDYLTDKELVEYYKILKAYSDLTIEVKSLIDQIEDKEEQKRQMTNLGNLSNDIGFTLKELMDEVEDRVSEKAESKGIGAVGSEQKEMGFLETNITSMSEQTRPMFRLLWQVKQERDTNNIKEIQKLDKELEEWQKKIEQYTTEKNMSVSDFYNQIINPNTKNLYTQFRKDWYEELKKARKSNDIKWLKDNLDKTSDYDSRYKKLKAEREKTIKILYTSATQEYRDKQLEEWEERNNLDNDKAWSNRYIFGENKLIWVKEPTKWESDNWKTIQQDKTLKDFYEWHIKTFKQYKEYVGDQDLYDSGVANIRRDVIDQFIEQGMSATMGSALESFLQSLRVQEGEFGSLVKRDVLTGKKEYEVPRMFINEIRDAEGKKRLDLKSTDLLKNMALFGRMAINYKHTKEIESMTQLMGIMLDPDFTGAVVEEKHGWERIKQKIVGNPSNLEAFEKYVNTFVYGQTTQDTQAREGEFSWAKLAQKAMSTHRYMTLPINVIGIAGAWGATQANSYFEAKKGTFFSTETNNKAHKLAITRNPEHLWLYEFLDLGGSSQQRVNKLSMNAAGRLLTKENAFIGFRFTDESEEAKTATKMALEYGLNAQGLPTRLEYLPQGSKPIYELIDLKTGEIKGLTLEGFTKYRAMVKKIAGTIKGGTSNEDLRNVNTNVFFQLLGQYKLSWLPDLFAERYRGARFDDTLSEFQLGRYRVGFGEFGGSFEDAAKTLKEKRKKGDTQAALYLLEYLKATGQSLSESKGFMWEALTLGLLGKWKGMSKERAELYFQKWQMENQEFIAEHPGMTEDQLRKSFIRQREGQLRALMAEVRIGIWLAVMIGLLMSDFDDDDEPLYTELPGFKQLFKVLKRTGAEVKFFYNPTDLMKLWANPIPVFGLFTTLGGLLTNTADETRDRLFGEHSGMIFWDEGKPDNTPPFHFSSKLLGLSPLANFTDWQLGKKLEKALEEEKEE